MWHSESDSDSDIYSDGDTYGSIVTNANGDLYCRGNTDGNSRVK